MYSKHFKCLTAPISEENWHVLLDEKITAYASRIPCVKRGSSTSKDTVWHDGHFDRASQSTSVALIPCLITRHGADMGTAKRVLFEIWENPRLIPYRRLALSYSGLTVVNVDVQYSEARGIDFSFEVSFTNVPSLMLWVTNSISKPCVFILKHLAVKFV